MRKYRMFGNTMIEVLIALLIIAIATTTGTKATTKSFTLLSSLHNSQTAHRLLGNIFENLHTIPANELSNFSAPSDGGCIATRPCKTSLWLSSLIRNWQNSAERLLPDGDTNISRNGDELEITVHWKEMETIPMRASMTYRGR